MTVEQIFASLDHAQQALSPFFDRGKEAPQALRFKATAEDDEGVPLPGAVLPELDKELCVKMQETMVTVNEFDKVFYDAQRQGRLSFYFTNRGEEAQAVGSAAALSDEDWVWPQYRELGVIFWRGYTMEECANRAPRPHHLSAFDALFCARTRSLVRSRARWLAHSLGRSCERAHSLGRSLAPARTRARQILNPQT